MAQAINIPVTIFEKDDTKPSLQVIALLKELQTMLSVLIRSGEASSIDVRSLPLMAHELQYLKKLLGEGEVKATVNALGQTRIHETEIAGIWWVTHFNIDDEAIAEFIEVTTFPEILKTQRFALEEGQTELEQRLLNKAVIKSNGG